MQSLKHDEDRRESARRHLYHRAKLRIGAGTPPRECLVLDISDTGVRLDIVGFHVPDEFVLLLSGDRIVERCKVIWRRDREVGAKFIGQEPPRAA